MLGDLFVSTEIVGSPEKKQFRRKSTTGIYVKSSLGSCFSPGNLLVSTEIAGTRLRESMLGDLLKLFFLVLTEHNIA